jgi:hypothetical protein
MLKVLGAAPVAALVPPASGKAAEGEGMPHRAPEQAAAEYKLKALDTHEWKTVQVLSDLIIPADERSGSATEAGVPEFIDDWLSFRGGRLLAQIRGGLTWLDMECNRLYGHDFVVCSAAEQKRILDRIAYPKTAAPQDSHAAAFFNELRNLVVSGFYSSKMGIQDLPYLGNTMVSDWEGCPPEVLAKLGLKSEGDKT